jgi:hypothetical protein
LRARLIVIGVLLLAGLAYWLLTSSSPQSPSGPSTEPTPPSSGESPQSPETSPVEQPPPSAEELQDGDLPAELICEGAASVRKPAPRRQTLTVMAACVEAQGTVMFVSRIPETGDYLVKIWPTARYSMLREACRSVATGELQLERDLVLIAAQEDWPKFSSVLQPEGPFTPYKIGFPVRVQGVYVFSAETSRSVTGPHCEIHPLQKLEIPEEPN